jgi:GT2 family glycosyltransferase
LRASVIITTKDRKDDLRRAIISCLAQTERVELIVIDDGSIDGTSELVAREFPQVTLIRTDHSEGYIAQRNRAAKIASGNILFSIDDDAEFSSQDIISDTLNDFNHPRIAAIAIPYLEPHKSLDEHYRSPKVDQTYVTDSFVGTAHALRKDIFLKLGGYRDRLVHQGEESDYCLRLLNAGYVVRLGNADPILHMESGRRDCNRVDYYGARNTVLFAYQNVPLPYFPFHLVAATWNVATWTLKLPRFANRMKAIGHAYAWCARNRGAREPVTVHSYLLFRRLRKHGPLRLTEIEPLLRPPQGVDS